MKATESFVRCLELKGVEYLFGLPDKENTDVMRSKALGWARTVSTMWSQDAMGFLLSFLELSVVLFITVDGGDGGTGAAPVALIDDVGLPLRESLPLFTGKLAEFGLGDRIKVVASGKLVTPSDVA